MHVHLSLRMSPASRKMVFTTACSPRATTLAPSTWGTAMHRFGRNRAWDSSPDSAPSTPDSSVPVVCAIDSLTHEVADDEFSTAASGRYRALCGAVIAAAPMSVPDGQCCEKCVTVRDQARAPRSSRRRSGARLVRRLA